MTDQHPITPSPELLQQWVDEFYDSKAAIKPGAGTIYIATQAAQWGANQELDACSEHIKKWFVAPEYRVAQLRAARRPKPKSLAEEGLQEIDAAECSMDSANLGYDFTAVRRALERLQELEGQQ